MKSTLLILVLALTGCAHVESTRSTFARSADRMLVLTIARHVDTIAKGPDIEEDQRLVLELRNAGEGRRYAIPSGEATARFSVQRFGPASKGETYRGIVVIKKIEDERVVANVNLVVTAETTDKSYKQTARYRGNYTFSHD